VPKSASIFYFTVVLQTLTDGTQYTEGICNATPAYCFYTTLGKLIDDFGTILADLLVKKAVKATSKLEDKISQ